MFKTNIRDYPFTSRREVVFAKNGMVATSQQLAAEAGRDILKQGGNAIDAAIATAACLTVVEPTSNGIGSDAFALVWVKDRLYGLNGSGETPAGLNREVLKALGYDAIPRFGLVPVTVPGTPGAWAALWQRFGKLPFHTLFEPAIKHANEGFIVSATVAKYWERAAKIYKTHAPETVQETWFPTFTDKDGNTPQAGDIWQLPDHARTLELIGRTEARAFYEGVLADAIDTYVQQHDGFLHKKDLEAYRPQWVEPIGINYRGVDIWELPPNGQGLIALQALKIMEGFPAKDAEDITTLHRQIESVKLAFKDGFSEITDQRHMRITPQRLLSEPHIKAKRDLIKPEAQDFLVGTPRTGGTVYLATADDEGNMVSFIQSNFMGFGSGVVVPGTGIALQNRGYDFSLEEDHINVLKPNKRAYHTIIPAFLSKNGKALGPFGLMAGYMQPQGHLQVVMNLFDFDMDPQSALDRYRWQWVEGKTIAVEPHTPQRIIDGLLALGHDVKVSEVTGSFGRAQIILRYKNGYIGACEARCDSAIVTY